MSRLTTIPLTPELLVRIGHLRTQMLRGETPPEVGYVKKRLAAAIDNAERLRVLFGGQIDQGSVDEAVF